MTEGLSDVDKAFLDAADSGDVEKLKHTIANSQLNVNVTDHRRFGATALHIAALKGFSEIVRILLDDERFSAHNILDNRSDAHDENDMDGNNPLSFYAYKFGEQSTALHYAVYIGDKNSVELLLACDKIDVNVTTAGFKAETALHIAFSESNNMEIIKMLLEHKDIDVNVIDKINGESILHAAVTSGDPLQIKYLLEEKRFKHLNLVDKSGNSILHNKMIPAEIVKLLLEDENCTTINTTCMANRTALHYAIDRNMFSLSDNPFEVAELLLNSSRFTAVDISDVEGSTALHWATEMGNEIIIKGILRHPRFTKKDAKNAIGVSALYNSIHRGNIEIVKLLLDDRLGDNKLWLAEFLVSNTVLFRNPLAFDDWMEVMIDILSCNGSLDWLRMLMYLQRNPLISLVSFPNLDKHVGHALKVTASAFANAHQANLFHIHLIGDGKAGKSVATKWIVDLLEKTHSYVLTKQSQPRPFEIAKPQFAHTDVVKDRTRGIKTTSLLFKDKRYHRQPNGLFEEYSENHFVVMIHDYGGQEEFLSNHANFMSTDNSIYIIVIPLFEIGDTIEQRRTRTITEMMERYLFWCRFVFSVVRKDDAFPELNVRTSSQSDKNLPVDNKNHRIPLFSLMNSFEKYCDDDQWNHMINAVRVLERQIRTEFTIGSKYDNHPCDFIVPVVGTSIDQTIEAISIVDCSNNKAIYGVLHHIDFMIKGTRVNGYIAQVAMVNHIVQCFDSTVLPVFMTKKQWTEWLTSSILSFPFSPNLNHESILSASQQQDMMKFFSSFCEQSLVKMNKIIVLKETVKDFAIVTNPSVLSTEILGDLLWWFHKHNVDKMDIHSLRLSQENIIEKLLVVDKERKQAMSWMVKLKSIVGMKSDMTAIDYLNNLNIDGGLSSLPLVELLNKMGVGLQIYDNNTKQLQSWLLGLAPPFPKGEKELRFDWWPDHEIRRYFRLPDTRACFIPGYFLRLFVNMVNNKGFEMLEGYGNAAKMSKVIFEEVADETGVRYVGCEVQILLCQLSDKDQDAFIVSVAAKGHNAIRHGFDALNVLRTLIYTDSWGLNFQEFCLPLSHVLDQTKLSIVREEFLEGKTHLDEVMPYVFGASQVIDNASDIAEVCQQWKPILFGATPKMSPGSASISTDDGIVRLRSQFQYKPDRKDLESKVFTDEHIAAATSNCTEMGELDLCLNVPDILQSYAQACYDTDLVEIAESPLGIDDIVEKVVKMHGVYDTLHVRENLFRLVQLWFCKRRKSNNDSPIEAPTYTLRKFECQVQDVLKIIKYASLFDQTPDMVIEKNAIRREAMELFAKFRANF